MENFPPLQPNKVYHIFSHAVNNTNIFFNEGNYDFMLRRWKEISKDNFKTYAFCQMPNHFHLCVQTLPIPLSENEGSRKPPRHQDSITFHSKKINNFLSSYTQALNKQQNRKGSLFRSRFGRIEVTNNTYFLDLICYIHHNPIHHFDSQNYSDWFYSSYNHFINPTELDFIEKGIAINRFGGFQKCKDHHEEYKKRKRHVPYEETVQEIFRQMNL
jgi:putative transposase